MRPIEFDQQTGSLGAGGNPNTGDLPICVAKDPETEGVVLILSCWEPSEYELAQIVRDKKIYIGVMANETLPTQPPIACYGFNPIEIYGFTVVSKKKVEAVVNNSIAMFKGACHPDHSKMILEEIHYDITMDTLDLLEDGSEPLAFKVVYVEELHKGEVQGTHSPGSVIYLEAVQHLIKLGYEKI